MLSQSNSPTQTPAAITESDQGHFFVEVENLMEGQPTVSIKVNYDMEKEYGVKYFTLSYLAVFAHYKNDIEESATAYILETFGIDSQVKFKQI